MIVKVVRAENLPAGDLNGRSDPFVKIFYEGKEVGASPRVKRSLNPRWDYETVVPLTNAGWMYLLLEVWDRDELSSNDLLGSLRVPFPSWRSYAEEYRRRLQGNAAQDHLPRKEHANGNAPTNVKPKSDRVLTTASAAATAAAMAREKAAQRAATGEGVLADTKSSPITHEQQRVFRAQQQASDAHRRTRSLNSFGPAQNGGPRPSVERLDLAIGDIDNAGGGRASSALTVSGYHTPTVHTVKTIAFMEEMPPVYIWSTLVKGSIAQGRVLCSIQYEERDLKFFVNQPYGTSIHEVFLPQNPRFKNEYCHLPRSWHPDVAMRRLELSAMHAGTPKDCLFPWNERLLHMVEEVTVTFHVNESNQGVLAVLVLTNYRIWFVPYRRVKGLLHEDVHTVSIGKILKASISQKKRGSNSDSVTVLELENMDAGHYHVTLSPIARLRDSARYFAREAEAKRIKQLHNIVAEIEWLKLENSFCAPYDLNHVVLAKSQEKKENIAAQMAASSSTMPPSVGIVSQPMLKRAISSRRHSKRQQQGEISEISMASRLSAPTRKVPPKGSLAIPTPPVPSPAAALTPPQPSELPQDPSIPPPSLKLHHHASEQIIPPARALTNGADAVKSFHLSTRRRIRYDAQTEFQRIGATEHPRWRQCHANKKYELCLSYPSFLMVPTSLSDDIIRDAARFRSKNRLPVLTWLHPRTGAPLCRSSQPNTGVLRSTNANDRDLIWAIRDAATSANAALSSPRALPKKNSMLHIVDARPEINAKGNALAGKGHESIKQYDRDGNPMASITFMGIDNIHAVRSSFAGLAQALYEVEDSNFFGAVQKSHWLEYVCSILQGASEVATHLERGDAVLVHCSDGWDRTAQLSSLAQLMLDPFYRTLEGFAILIEKDWCSFGHMFKKRCGHPTSDQSSPIFQQFLDAVYQLTLQFPMHFQFNELLLSSISEAVYSSWYGTFQMNSERERNVFLANVPSVSVWDVIRASTDQYLNPLFGGGDGVYGGGASTRMEAMLPVCRVRVMQLWSSQYQKAISHMRLQQRELEMQQLIRQQETELSRMYEVMNTGQRMQLRAIQLRADISSLARSMNLEYPHIASTGSPEGSGDDVGVAHNGTPSNGSSSHTPSSSTTHGRKRVTAASVDFHELTFMASTSSSTIASVSSNGISSAASDASSQARVGGNGAPSSRRRSINARSRSNSLRLKKSLRSMMGHFSSAADKDNDAGGDNGSTQNIAATAAAFAAATTASPRQVHMRSPVTARIHHVSPTANASHQRHEALKKELQQLESQFSKLNSQVAKKEDVSWQMMRRFRCYNYSLPESALTESEANAPTNAGKAIMQQRSNSRRKGERYPSPSAFSPPSASPSGSGRGGNPASLVSPSLRQRDIGNALTRDDEIEDLSGASLDDSRDDERHCTPGGTALLTGDKVISSAGNFLNAQPVWERDVDAPCCKRCKKKFKTFYRNRHHCRCCGYVFCGRCTSNRMNLPEFGYYDVVRVCLRCYDAGEVDC